MMGLGSLDYSGVGVGGGGGAAGGMTSPTTSNLSPLAPPFTIDLSNHNKSYGLDQESFAYLSSSHGNNNWLHLHPPTTATTTLSESFTNLNLEIESLTGYVPSTTTPTSNNNQNYSYGEHNKPYYFDSQTVGNLGGGGANGNTFVPIVSPNATSVANTAACNSFTHVHRSDKVFGKNLIREGLEPYYQPRFPLAGVRDKKSSPSVVIRKPDGSDIITVSGAPAPPEMAKSVHYTPNVSGLDYGTPTWGGFWNRAGEWEDQGSRKEHDGNFGWTEKVLTGSSTSKNSPFEETPLADGWTAACGEASGVSLGKTVEPLPGEYGINSLSAKFESSVEENVRTSVSNMPRHSLFSSSTYFPEISEPPFPVDPYTVSATKPWSQLSANNSSFNQSFSSLDDPQFYSSSAYFSVGPTSSAVGTIFSAPNKSAKSANVNPIERAGNTCFNSEDPRDYTPSSAYRKDPLIQLSVDLKESIADASSVKDEMDRTNHTSMNSSILQKDIMSNGGPILQNSWNQFFNGEHENQVNFNDASTVKPTVASVESSSDTFDRLNPPVDSPCWKGAPAFRSFPFTGKEVQDPQVFPINDGDDTASVSKSENGNPISKENEQEANGNISSSLQGLPLKARDRNGVQLSYGSEERNKEGFVASKAGEKVTVGRGLDTADPVGEGSDTSASKQRVLELDAGLLINAMHNLSELLLATCSTGVSTLREQDHEILQRITINLNTCALMKPGTMRSGPGLSFPQSMGSCSDKSLPDTRKGVVGGISQVTTKESCAHQNQCESQTVVKGGMSSTMCQELVSQFGDIGLEKDNDMIQRIKKHLKESRNDFDDDDDGGDDDDDDDDEEEVSLSRVQLYKNLWLEAEAAMCSMKYNARCASMKIEKEYRQQQEKDSCMTGKKPINVEERLSSKILGNQNSFEALSSPTKHKLSATTTQETSQTNTNNQVEDVEASVMARLHLLKCRVDNSSSMSTEGNQLQGVKDSLNTKTTTKESSNANTNDQVNDIEASVMARLNILKWRVDNSSCVSTDGNQPQEYTNNVANTETAKRTYSPDRASGTNVEIKAQPIQVVEQGFTKRSKLWPFVVVDETEDEISNLQGIKDVPYVGGLCVPGESIIQSYIPDRFGKRVSVGSYDSPSSSEWEHVLKDELTWQN
ncbi:hypothetical protein C5167_012848 [Papaver somniferum]|uniref:Uncharacterized protein n=1 Tax=Papaver somniferum TaxID=3469 RepID=A0A4Y7J2X8_PAPSO|nr:uncharacterized protein LOC113355996 isoform X1 [Papaver somniferum]RZC53995.1 hypothetical protein C5167_012848 [Papaver somniferum]